jgi:hypothetical protein
MRSSHTDGHAERGIANWLALEWRIAPLRPPSRHQAPHHRFQLGCIRCTPLSCHYFCRHGPTATSIEISPQHPNPAQTPRRPLHNTLLPPASISLRILTPLPARRLAMHGGKPKATSNLMTPPLVTPLPSPCLHPTSPASCTWGTPCL